MLLTQTEFNREVSRERIRATRRCIPFCIVTIELLGRKQLASRRRSIVRMLHRNVRLTDQKADLGRNRFSILLVDTPEMGGRAVLDRLSGICDTKHLNVCMELKVHDPEGFNSDDHDESMPTGDGRRRRDDQAGGKWYRVDSNDSSAVRMNSGSVDAVESMESFETSGSQQTVASLAKSAAIPSNGAGGTTATVSEAAIAVRAAAAPATHLSVNDQHEISSQLEIGRRGSRRTQVTCNYVSAEDTLVHPPLTRRFMKRSLDIVGASVGIVMVSPLLIGGMLAVKLTSKGPALFKQTREGKGGRPFTIYKMRTMVVDAESKQASLRKDSHRDGPAFKIKHDPRVTKVGHFLRRTCIDELPQLFNVLKGDMSLVGPRPLPWHESRACGSWHRRRLDVRPGMTCHWQVDKAAAETFDDWMRMDLQYVDRNSFWQDLRLIIRTVIVPVTGRGSE